MNSDTPQSFISSVPIIHKVPTSSILSKRPNSHGLTDTVEKKLHPEQVIPHIPSQLINIVPSSEVLVPTIIISPKPLTREELDRVVRSTHGSQNIVPFDNRSSNSFAHFGAQAIATYSPLNPLLTNNTMLFNEPNKQSYDLNSTNSIPTQTPYSLIPQDAISPLLLSTPDSNGLVANSAKMMLRRAQTPEVNNISPINLSLIKQLSSLSQADEILVIPLKPQSLYNQAHLPTYPLMLIPEGLVQDKEDSTLDKTTASSSD